MDGEGPGGPARRGFLARLPDDLADELTHSAQSVTYPRGAVNLLGSDRETAALVQSGLLRYFISAADGRQLTVRYLAPGDLVGTLVTEPSDGTTRIEALQPSTVLLVDVERLHSLSRRRPELAQALAEELTHRLRSSFRVLAARAFMSVRSRVARDLLERARAMGPVRPGVRLWVTHQALADATGSVREVVGRSLARLRQEGVIASDGAGITLLDPDALARLAEPGPPPRR